jgi:hypothetical protein
MCTYVANGAWLAVLIDPPPYTVEIYAPDVDPRVLEAVQTASLEAIGLTSTRLCIIMYLCGRQLIFLRRCTGR